MSEKALVEAALFMSSRPLTPEDFEKLGVPRDRLERILEELSLDLESGERGITLWKGRSGYRLMVKPEYAAAVSHLAPHQDMGKGLLRVLALAAYRPGITQSDVVKIVGNRAYEYIRELEARGLVKTEKKGRTRQLFVTREFADYFGLKSPDEAKKVLSDKADLKERV